MRDVRQQSVKELIDKHLDEGDTYYEIIDRFSNSLVVHALAKTHGNISQAAKVLGIHRHNVERFMTKFKIDADEFKEIALDQRNGHQDHAR